jgi:hypothetical protein
MDYQLTKHAEDALEKRRIPREWMERVLFSPEWTEPDSLAAGVEHRLAPIAEFQGRILRVVVNAAVEPARVITVYFDRRRKAR